MKEINLLPVCISPIMVIIITMITLIYGHEINNVKKRNDKYALFLERILYI